jgi:glycoside/pentoside/hexuronide:cation symporter, GPH family
MPPNFPDTVCRRANAGLMFGYALGEGALSIALNGVSNFGLLYYTQSLGMTAGAAGLALSISLLWDGFCALLMGPVTDNTRSRYGRRHLYIGFGGILLAISFFSLWHIPEFAKTASELFWYVLLVNLTLRTAAAMFSVPYAALGFEICPDSLAQTKLQGIRYCVNQVVNLVFGAMAWCLFFRDKKLPDGTRLDGTQVIGNYHSMGAVLASAALGLIALCIWSTRGSVQDSRRAQGASKTMRSFTSDLADVFRDRMACVVLGFFGFAQLGILMVSQLQMFTYVSFMQFNNIEKTCVHGAGIIAFALGSLTLPVTVRLLNKKGAGIFAVAISICGGGLLNAFFASGLVSLDSQLHVCGFNLRSATVLFAALQMLWWGGCGIIVPLATSMIADASRQYTLKSGTGKDGSYAAVFSIVQKGSSFLGLLLTGWAMGLAGYASGTVLETPQAVHNVALLTFLSGPVMMIIALIVLQKYNVNQTQISESTALSMNDVDSCNRS